MRKSLPFITLLFAIFMASGRETWRGAKQDASDGDQWSKEKVNDEVKYIEKKQNSSKF